MAIPSVARPRARLDPLRWIRAHCAPAGGVAVSANDRRPYPEVTGYLIPGLLQRGEAELARRFAEWLVQVQRSDGSFAGPDGDCSYAFDTGQALRGLVAMLPLQPELAAPARAAADWLLRTARPGGRLQVPQDPGAWDLGARGRIPEAVHLYVLPALLQAGHALGERRYTAFARASRDSYLRQAGALGFRQPNMLSHFFGYVHEALVDLDAADAAARAFAELREHQRDDGAIPAFHDVEWVCLPGQLQAAIVWQKLGEHERAAAALAFAESGFR